jgi:two-component system sensor histidine kinase RegB
VPNVWLHQRSKADRPPPGVNALSLVLVGDVAVLTGLLALSGGAHNPFAVLYLFEVMVAALVLPPLRVAVLCAIGGAAYGSLFLNLPHVHDPTAMSHHLVGMWVAYGVAAPFVAFGIHRLRRGLADADARAEEARRRLERTERLASLATLAAGAAHEIANPLATIAVVAGELERSRHPEVVDDGKLVRAEVERCRAVLQQLSAQVGAGTGEPARPIRVDQLLEEIVRDRPEARLDAIDAPDVLRATEVLAPARLVGQAVRRLIVNAREASGPDAPVVLEVRRAGGVVAFTVVDHGSGMSPEVSARVGEPFYSTKARGMGLGLYFARSVAEAVGGRLELRSSPGGGTEVALMLPVAT